MSGEPAPLEVEWKDCVDAVRSLAAAARAAVRGGRPVLVGITGPVGSGKTTLADALGGCRVATDDYLPEYERLAEEERDDPRHADLDLLAAHLASLRAGRGVAAPVWCFHQHRRIGTRHVEPDTLIVCEGIFALERRVRTLLDVAVYVDAPASVRWARWERIEASGERGWGIQRAREYFERVAEPTFLRFAEEYRAAAHVIVRNEGLGASAGGKEQPT